MHTQYILLWLQQDLRHGVPWKYHKSINLIIISTVWELLYLASLCVTLVSILLVILCMQIDAFNHQASN